MLLTTHDIRNEAGDAVWNQGEVRAGLAVAGYWAVECRKAGRYTIELRRWPAETGVLYAHAHAHAHLQSTRNCMYPRTAVRPEFERIVVALNLN